MAYKTVDRVKVTSSTTGTGTWTLGSAESGFRTFTSVLSNSDTCPYVATDGNGNWEIGLGTFSSGGNTLARTTVKLSSNSNNAVNFTDTVTIAISPLALDLSLCGFKAHRITSTQSVTSGAAPAVMIFNSEDWDTEGAYDTTTGIYTIPTGKDGIWSFTTGVYWDQGGTGVSTYLYHYNSADVEQARSLQTNPTAGVVGLAFVTTEYNVIAGDKIHVQVYQNTGGARAVQNDTATYFCGHRLGRA